MTFTHPQNRQYLHHNQKHAYVLMLTFFNHMIILINITVALLPIKPSNPLTSTTQGWRGYSSWGRGSFILSSHAVSESRSTVSRQSLGALAHQLWPSKLWLWGAYSGLNPPRLEPSTAFLRDYVFPSPIFTSLSWWNSGKCGRWSLETCLSLTSLEGGSGDKWVLRSLIK